MRKERDVHKLMQSQLKVIITNEKDNNELKVWFIGPHGSPYEGGQWEIRVTLPEQYPFKSPSIGFGNRIYHPNIDEV